VVADPFGSGQRLGINLIGIDPFGSGHRVLILEVEGY